MPGRSVKRLPSCLSRPRNSSIQRRTYSAKALASDALGPILHDEQHHQSLRVLKDGNKLPLPPLLDPVVRLERSRWQQPKERPNVANFTPFQKKLWENPYAHTLASPLRECRATFTLLPSPLLLSLHPRPHPTTTTPWLLPVSLTTPTTHLGPPYRFLAHSFITTHLSKKRTWERGLYARMTEKLGRRGVDSIVWREDMPKLVLELMRKRVREKLGWWFGWRGRLVRCKSPASGDLEDIEDVGCVLYLDTLRTRADDLQDEVAAITTEGEKWTSYFIKGFPQCVDPHKAPGVTHSSPLWYIEPLVPRLQPRIRFPRLEFKTAMWRGRKVAVFSLLDMLGEQNLKALVEGSQYEGARCLVLKRGRQNVDMEMLLMQLQAYLAEPGP